MNELLAFLCIVAAVAGGAAFIATFTVMPIIGWLYVIGVLR